MQQRQPTVRLHLWLESGEMTVVGAGRVFLLDLIEEHGSLRKAARILGMSYRAAWGKLHASEQALGVKLIEPRGNKRDGCRLSEQGRRIRDMFKQWYEAVELEALAQAESIFPWGVHGFRERADPAAGPSAVSAGLEGLADSAAANCTAPPCGPPGPHGPAGSGAAPRRREPPPRGGVPAKA
ncbi:MAG: LysR family transcriptional regulator [Desulfovibrionaceae bacterium]|jgi:molybdate transport system regulatory protein|nr:LysR family transcriptional regulator [Desulfovibrionaceae bacterium]